MFRNVRQVIQLKSDIWSISPQASVFEALELMAEKDIGAVLVMEDDKLVGILSERDYARKVILRGRSSKTTTVGELMTRHVYTIDLDASMKACMALMTEKHIRHLPVVDGEKLLGVITIGDAVKAIISDQESMINQMENYITGRGYGN